MSSNPHSAPLLSDRPIPASLCLSFLPCETSWEALLASLWWELRESYPIQAPGSTCMLSTCWIPVLSTKSSYWEFLLTLEVTSIRQSLQLRSRFLECPTWPSSASVFESRIQGVNFWVEMGVKQKLTTSSHKDKPNESKRFPNDNKTSWWMKHDPQIHLQLPDEERSMSQQSLPKVALMERNERTWQDIKHSLTLYCSSFITPLKVIKYQRNCF